jgi:hypothetical protein
MIPLATTALHLWPCLFRTQCAAPDCPNLARIIVRYVEDGGAPAGQTELCNTHTRAVLEAANADDIAIFNMRK